MKRITFTAAIAAMLMSSAALAETPAPAQPVQQLAPPIVAADPLTIKISRSNLQLIGQGIMKLPYESAAPLLVDLQNQLNAMDEAARQAAAPKPEPEKPKK